MQAEVTATGFRVPELLSNDPVLSHEFGYRWVRVDPQCTEYPDSRSIYHTIYGPHMRLVQGSKEWFLDVPKGDVHAYRHYGMYLSLDKALKEAEIHYLMTEIG
jgi:hypothetical protein